MSHLKQDTGDPDTTNVVFEQSRLVYCLFLLCLFTPSYAWAYIDVGAGSLLLQTVIAAGLAVGYTVKVYWRGLVGWFSGSPSSQPSEDEQEPDTGGPRDA